MDESQALNLDDWTRNRILRDHGSSETPTSSIRIGGSNRDENRTLGAALLAGLATWAASGLFEPVAWEWALAAPFVAGPLFGGPTGSLDAWRRARAEGLSLLASGDRVLRRACLRTAAKAAVIGQAVSGIAAVAAGCAILPIRSLLSFLASAPGAGPSLAGAAKAAAAISRPVDLLFKAHDSARAVRISLSERAASLDGIDAECEEEYAALAKARSALLRGKPRGPGRVSGDDDDIRHWIECVRRWDARGGGWNWAPEPGLPPATDLFLELAEAGRMDSDPKALDWIEFLLARAGQARILAECSEPGRSDRPNTL